MASALPPDKALSTGSDLWIVADLDHSKWTSKIDWYLNFQIVKASRHESPELSGFLKEALEQTGLTAPQIKTGNGPLLIQSEFLLPNKWVLVLPFEEDIKSWMSKVAEVWEGLQKPSLRIFLPTGQNSSPHSMAWFEKLELKNCSLVLDLSN
jgi:hypothetical protein